MNIIDRRSEKKGKGIIGNNVPIGTVFSGIINGTDGKPAIYLRTYNQVVNLARPSATWSALEHCNIYDYVPVQVSLVIEGESQTFLGKSEN